MRYGSMGNLLPDDQLIYWVNKVATEFYELVYKDPWFKKLFVNISQEIITSQQTDFMVQSLGGPKNFCGRGPKDSHPQVWIDEDIWNYREDLLKEAARKVNAPKDLIDAWIRIDNAFKAVIINKGGPEECTGRFKTDDIIYEPMPDYLKRRSS